ncbi:unnamed protein product [Rotaria sp. Silwood1]|nr:unnamed protein product [Rotaria sp. Silwood1]CAF1597545.1 unnamed protein product [Rotaria sp. Silwood1]CAF4775015.1 unnamed protein product [Rotaria sp. Silwood1]CAF4775599.1 unnamed protein product [Rotaria sp. Silwood1]
MISIIRRLHGFRRTMSNTSTIKIGTHNGHFHCDEIFACFLLKTLPRYANAEIIRTRDPKILAECDTVVDVGGVFNAEQRRFDHHQKSFTDTFHSLQPDKPWTIRLSSAGLIYVHYGREIIKELLKKETLDNNIKEYLTEILFNKLYETFVEEIDAIDNGVDIGENMKYKIHTNLSARVGYFNPSWNDPNPEEKEEIGFKQAMDMIGKEFLDRFNHYIHQWWPARALLEKAIARRFEIDPSGSIIVLDCPCPWRDHLFDIEQEQKEILNNTIKYVLYPDSNKTWRIQAVPLNKKSFENRLSLPQQWQGLRDNELSIKANISGCIFVHASGFIGGNATYDGALAMAQRSLQLEKTQ